MKSYWQGFIDGQWVDGDRGERIAIEDPATGHPFAEVARASPKDVDRAVSAARRCADSRTLIDMAPATRSQMLFRVAEYLRARATEIGHLLTLESGIQRDAGLDQVLATSRYFEYYGGMADKLEGRCIPLGRNYLDYTTAEPHGVSAHIVPWNFPLELAARGVAPALAAGNAVVVKSPELDPLAITVLAEACDAAGFPPGAINVLCGIGREAGAALSSHPGIDQIVFTGGVVTGKAILHAASDRLIPAVIELGGKSAAVVLPGADLRDVRASVKAGIFYFGGQICSALSRLIVHRSSYAEVVGAIEADLGALTMGPGIDNHYLTPLISAAHLMRVRAMVTTGAEQGAKVIEGPQTVGAGGGHFMPPTLLINTTPDMRVMQEEIFGPVLSICPFETEEEAVQIANGTHYGLCAGVFTRDLNEAHRLARRLHAGQVFVNEWFAGGIETPFGGVKQSGYGREKGQEAILNYIRTKNVAIRMRAG